MVSILVLCGRNTMIQGTYARFIRPKFFWSRLGLGRIQTVGLGVFVGFVFHVNQVI